jgi:hypothetical protein
MMTTFARNSIALLLACCSVSSALAAGPVPVLFYVRDSARNPVVATLSLTASCGTQERLVTNAAGAVGTQLPAGTIFTVTVKAPGYDDLTFVRPIPAGSATKFVMAGIIMYRPVLGQSYLTEYRVGLTRPGEQLAQDLCLIAVWVRNFANSAALRDSVLGICDASGKLIDSRCTDANGYCYFLVKEMVPLTLRVHSLGYASYITGIYAARDATTRNVEIRLRRIVP